ncbi:helix-hairpin-helix domain-containing protein [Burkholderiaceae bacterium DAT-1]|nr:helix-hairpin-helix domain-containing protein [Burkholderiaceae bacterium DAT-1]
MNPAKVSRDRLNKLTDLPNIGPASAKDLQLLGYETPDALKGADPVEMYWRLCDLTGVRHDPCVLDVFMSVTRFMDGEPPRAWWDFTEARKRLMAVN